MSEQIITTKRGIYGRVNVTLPLPMKKAEFLRLALTTGFLVLSKGIPTDVGDLEHRQPARTLGEDGLPVKDQVTGLS